MSIGFLRLARGTGFEHIELAQNIIGYDDKDIDRKLGQIGVEVGEVDHNPHAEGVDELRKEARAEKGEYFTQHRGGSLIFAVEHQLAVGHKRKGNRQKPGNPGGNKIWDVQLVVTNRIYRPVHSGRQNAYYNIGYGFPIHEFFKEFS